MLDFKAHAHMPYVQIIHAHLFCLFPVSLVVTSEAQLLQATYPDALTCC